MRRLEGKVAVITGSGQGVGRPIAIGLAREGASVITNNRKPGSTSASTYGDDFFNSLPEEQQQFMLDLDAKMNSDAEATAREIVDKGGKAIPFFGDVSDFEVASKLIQTAVDNFGRIDILVNAAGTFGHYFIWEMPEKEWDRVGDVSLKGSFNCIRHAIGYMKEQKWGRIINTTSGAWLGVLEHSNYAAAKAGVVGLTRAVALDVHKYGITCNAFAPTAMTRSIYNLIARARVMAQQGNPLMSPQALERIESTPAPDGIAPFIVYLATDEAANITGTVFACRGSRIGIYSEPEVVGVINKEDDFWTLDELVQIVPKQLLKEYMNIVDRRNSLQKQIQES